MRHLGWLQLTRGSQRVPLQCTGCFLRSNGHTSKQTPIPTHPRMQGSAGPAPWCLGKHQSSEGADGRVSTGVSCLASALSQACHLFGTQFQHFLKEEKTSTKGNSCFSRYFCHQKIRLPVLTSAYKSRGWEAERMGVGGYNQWRCPITHFSVTCLFHSTLCWNTRT